MRGLVIMLLGLIFCTVETIYFGCNWAPQSNAEVICDGISCMIVAIGAVKCL